MLHVSAPTRRKSLVRALTLYSVASNDESIVDRHEFHLVTLGIVNVRYYGELSEQRKRRSTALYTSCATICIRVRSAKSEEHNLPSP